MVGNYEVNNYYLFYTWGMAGFSRGQNVPLHSVLHQLGASTNSNKMLYRLITVACTGLLSAAELICFRTLAVSCIALQLTKSLSLGSLHLIWILYRLLESLIIPGVKAAQARLYQGILWPEPFYTPGILWPEEV